MAELGQLYYTLTAKDEGLAKVISDAKKEFQGMDNAILKLNKTDSTGKLNAAFAETGKTIEQVKSQLSILQMQWNKLEFGDSAARNAVISEYEKLSKVLDKAGTSMDKIIASKNKVSAFSMPEVTLGDVSSKLSSLKSERLTANASDLAKYNDAITVLVQKQKELESATNIAVQPQRTLNEVLSMETNTLTQVSEKISELKRLRNEQNKTDSDYIANMSKISQAEKQLIQQQKQALSIGINKVSAFSLPENSLGGISSKISALKDERLSASTSEMAKYNDAITVLVQKQKELESATNIAVQPQRTLNEVLAMESNTLNQVTAKLAELKRVRGEQSMTDSDYVSNMSRIMQSETALRQQQQQALEIGIKKETVEQRLNNVLSQQPKTLEGIIAAQKELNSLYGKIDVSDISKKEQIIAKNKELAASANQYGMSLKNSSATTYDFTSAMAMQATTLDQVKQKMSAIAAARLQENIKTEQGRKNVSMLSAEYNKLQDVLERNGVRARNLNADLLGQGRIMSQLKSYAAMYISVFSAANFLKSLVDITGQFEMQKVALGAIIHSTEKAQLLFSQIQELGLKSPFTTLDLTGYVKQLSAYQIDTNELFGTTSRLADLSAGLGVDMSRLVLAFGQVKSASVLRGQELRQFTEAGIPLVDALAKKFSELNGRAVTTGEVFDIISKRGVSFQMVKNILWDMTDAGGKFYNMQEKIADTTYGKIENLRDAWEKQLNIIGSSNKGLINFGVDTLRLVIDNMSTLGSVIKTVLELYGTYRVAMLINTAVTSTMTVAEVAHYAALVASEKAQKLLNITTLNNPYVAVGAAVLSLAVLLWNLKDSTDANAEALQKFNEEQAREEKYLDEHKQKVESLIRTVNDEAKSQYERIRALNDLKTMYPSIIKKYIDEEGHLRNLIGLRNELNNTYDNFTLRFDQNQLKSSKERFLKLGAAVNARLSGGQTTGDYSGITTPELQKMLVEEKTRYFGLQSKVNDEVKLFNQNKKTITPFLSEVSTDIDKATKSFQKLNKTSSDLGISMPKAGDSETETIKNLSDAYDSATKTIQTYGKSKLKEHGETIANARAVINLVSEIEKKTGVSIRNGKYEKAENTAANKAKRAQEAKDKIQAETDQRKKDLLVMQAEISKIEADAQIEIAQTSIDAMDDGFAKRRSQIALNYEKDFATASKSAADYLAKLQKESDKQYLINNPNYAKQGKKAPTLTYGTLTTEQKSTYDNFFNVATDKQIADTNNAIKELLAANEDFKTQLEQREKQYNDTVSGLEKSRTEQNSAQIDAALKEATKLYEQDLSKIKFDDLKDKIDWTEVFGNLDTMATDSLNKLRDKLKKFVSEIGNKLSPEVTKEITASLKEIDSILADKNPITELSSSYKDYKKACDEVIKAQKIVNDLQGGTGVASAQALEIMTKKLTKAQRDKADSQARMNKSIQSISSAGKDVVSAGQDVIETLEIIGVKVSDSIKQTVKGVGDVFDGLASIDLTNPFTIIAGSIKVMKGEAEIIMGLFGGNSKGTENYNKLKKSLEGYLEVLDKVISKQKEATDGLVGMSAVMASQKATDDIEKQIQAYRDLAAAAGKAGASMGSHSYAVRTNKRLKNDWDAISKSAGETIDSIDDLYNLSSEQLKKIMIENPLAWSKIDSEIRGYLENIIDAGDSISDIMDDANEALTGLSFDEAKSSLDEFIQGADTSLSDVTEDFEEKMRNAVLNSLKSEYLDSALSDWNDRFSKAMSDGVLSASEASDLESMYESIYSTANEKYKASLAAAGVDVSSSERSGVSKGIATASQDSIDELAGGVYALLDISATSRNNLQAINNSTANMSIELQIQTAILNSMDLKLDKVRISVDNMNLSGIKLKS